MRVVVGSESTRDLRQSELRRHLQMMSRFLEVAKVGSSLTMILRSAGSDPAKQPGRRSKRSMTRTRTD